MIGKEYKHVVIRSAFENLSASLACENIQEGLRIQIITAVVDMIPTHSIDILAIGCVEQLPFQRILNGIHNIIVHHQNDVLFRNAFGLYNSVGMANICLMTVI